MPKLDLVQRILGWSAEAATGPLSPRSGHDEVAGQAVEPPFSAACPGGSPVPAEERCAGADCDSVALTDLMVGGVGTVSCLAHPESPRAWKLAALGVLPGTTLRLVQRYPAYVFRIGHGEFAVDEGLAAEIRVRPV